MDFRQFKLASPKKNLKLHLDLTSRMDVEPIFEFVGAVEDGTKRRLKDLARDKKKDARGIAPGSVAYEILGSYFEDQVDLAEATSDLSHKFAVVALYSRVEIHTKRMCEIAIEAVNRSDLFRWKSLKKVLLRNSIDLTKVACYSEVNQLRCLNNAIKHGETVSEELEEAGWGREGDSIDAKRCSQELRIYSEACDAYLADLRSKLGVLIDGLTDEGAKKLLKVK